jgi:hypothetical protein
MGSTNNGMLTALHSQAVNLELFESVDKNKDSTHLPTRWRGQDYGMHLDAKSIAPTSASQSPEPRALPQAELFVQETQGCDEWCRSGIELVGHHTSRENHANNQYYKYGQLMIDVRAISIFIVAGGDLVAMWHCRTLGG